MNCIRDPSPKQQQQQQRRNPSDHNSKHHRPESVVEVTIPTPSNSTTQEPAERGGFDLHRQSPPAMASHRSASPFIKQPKIIKNEGDRALYVKLSDLPENIREHLHIDIGTDISEMDTEEETSQPPNDNIGIGGGGGGGFARGADPSRHRHGAPPSNMSFDEPKRLSAQPTVEEIQMCFAQIDLAILMDGKTRPSPKPIRFESPKRGGSHQRKPCDEDPPPPPPPQPGHRMQSPSPRRKDKWTSQTNPSPPPPPPPSSPPPPPPPPTKEYNGHTGFISDESLSKKKAPRHPSVGKKKDGIGSAAQRRQTMDELLQRVGRRRQEKKIREDTKKKLGNHANDESHFDDDGEDEEEEELLDSSKRRGHHHNDSMSFCGVGGGLSMITNDFKSKLKHMHAMAAASPIHERSKKLWPKDAAAAHHVRYKSSWSGTSQEEYQVDPNEEDSDEQ